MSFDVRVVPTKPFDGQKPGTSGLRKKTSEFEKEHYTENFVQACFNALGTDVKGSTLLVGGDGRYFLRECLDIILRIGAANGVKKFIVPVNGVVSTPAASNIIRINNALGGFILTASHNPGGPTADFGIKYNSNNGGPALEKLTDRVYHETCVLTEYMVCDLLKYTLDTPGEQALGPMTLHVVDAVGAYVAMCRELFDFDALQQLLARPAFRCHIDAMHGVAGPFATRIFVDELKAGADSVVHNSPLPDFGGLHPDPNLTYAKDLVEAMATGAYDFGAAFDGDADRNMVLGRDVFVNPSDSVAIIAANYQHIKYFRENGLKGLARSMPTSAALDRVAKKLGVEFFETPTGWKFFGNLMDAGRLSLCGEESFGQGSDAIREKDGIWAVLAWLSILAHTGLSVQEVVHAHWREFGRNFFTRYDYEGVRAIAADELMANLRTIAAHQDMVDKPWGSFTVMAMDDFAYQDPVDGSRATKQGVRVMLTDGSRVIFRLSGTGSSDATIRLYVEKYESDPDKIFNDPQEALQELVALSLKLSDMARLTGMDTPTVIT